MRPQDWFGVGLRLIGVWSILKGIGYLASYIDQLSNWSGTYVSGASPNQYLIYIFSDTAIGMILLGFAPAITRLTYPSNEADLEANSDTSGTPVQQTTSDN